MTHLDRVILRPENEKKIFLPLGVRTLVLSSQSCPSMRIQWMKERRAQKGNDRHFALAWPCLSVPINAQKDIMIGEPMRSHLGLVFMFLVSTNEFDRTITRQRVNAYPVWEPARDKEMGKER